MVQDTERTSDMAGKKRSGSASIVTIAAIVALAILALIVFGGGADAPEPVDVNTTTLDGDAPGDPVDVPAAGTTGDN